MDVILFVLNLPVPKPYNLQNPFLRLSNLVSYFLHIILILLGRKKTKACHMCFPRPSNETLLENYANKCLALFHISVLLQKKNLFSSCL